MAPCLSRVLVKSQSVQNENSTLASYPSYYICLLFCSLDFCPHATASSNCLQPGAWRLEIRYSRLSFLSFSHQVSHLPLVKKEHTLLNTCIGCRSLVFGNSIAAYFPCLFSSSGLCLFLSLCLLVLAVLVLKICMQSLFSFLFFANVVCLSFSFSFFAFALLV